MKQIIIILLSILFLNSFSQTEIWGVKLLDGANRGGFLYTIDSATKKIQIQHRFQDLYPNDAENSLMRPYYLENSNSYLFMIQGKLMKFDVQSAVVQEVYLERNIYGELFVVNDSTAYGICEDGVIKINPVTLDYTFIEDQLYTFLRTDVGFQMLDANKLVYHVEEELNIGKIKVLNLSNDQISDLVVMNTPDIGFHPFGKIQKVGDAFYGALRVENWPDRYYKIYKYTPSNNKFELVKSMKNKSLTVQRMNGLTQIGGNKLFSLAAISDGNRDLIAFTYNPVNNSLDSLNVFPESLGRNIEHSFIYLTDQYILSSTTKGSDYNSGCVFSFDINTNKFESIYIKDSVTNENINLVFSKIDENNIAIVKPQLVIDERFNLISYDVSKKTENWHEGLVSPFSYNKGASPYDIIQMENGNILGTAQRGGNTTTSNPYDLGKGLLYEFDPGNKKFNVIHHFDTFDINYYYPTELFKVGVNQYVGILHNGYTSSVIKQGKFLYDADDKTFSMLESFPWAGLMNDYAQMNDSSIFIIPRLRNSKDQNTIIRYNLLNDSYDTAIYVSNEYEVSNLLLDDAYLIFQQAKKDHHDSAFVYKMDLVDGSTEELFCVNDIFGDTTLKVELSFNYFKNGVVKGNIIQRKTSVDKIVTEYHSISYDIDINEYKIYRSYSYDGDITFYEGEIDYFYEFENTFNDVLVVRGWSENDYAGEISIINQDDELEVIDVFERYHSEYVFSLASLYNPASLKLFQKKDFSKHWNGSYNSDWYEPKNWTGSIVPDSTDMVTIDAFVSHFPIIDTLAKCKSMVVSHSASFTVEPNGMFEISEDVYNYGQILLLANDSAKASFIHHKDFEINQSTSYKYVGDTSIRELLASPMETQGFRQSDRTDFYSFAQEVSQWSLIQNFPFYPRVGNAYFYDQQFNSLIFNGEIHHQDVEIEIPYNTEKRMYPIPNPFTASLDWTQIDLSTLSNKALYRYHWEDSTFTAFVDGLGWQTPLIEPLDVVWVYSSGNESVHLKSSDRVYAPLHEMEPLEAEKELILSVTGQEEKNETLIKFNDLASSKFEGEYDAAIPVLEEADKLHLFTQADEELLSINQLPDTAMMDVYVEAHQRGIYTISLEENSGFDFLVLEDLIWNKRVDLLKEDYSFEYFNSDGHYPFKLYFEPWVLEPLAEEDIHIYYYPESIFVRSSKQIEFAEIEFFDLAGRAVLQLTASQFFSFEKPIKLPAGHYIVQLRSGNLITNQKILVR